MGTRGFGVRIGFGKCPALIVIDMINAFTDPGMPLGSNLDAVVAQVRQVLRAGRNALIPVFYTRVGYEEGMADAGIWRLKQKGTSTLRLGTPAVEVDERLAPAPGEQIILKKYASAFFGTDLASRLTSLGVDTLLIAGCTTSGCVRATAVDAVQLGYRPMVVREAVGDRSPAAHVSRCSTSSRSTPTWSLSLRRSSTWSPCQRANRGPDLTDLPVERDALHHI